MRFVNIKNELKKIRDKNSSGEELLYEIRNILQEVENKDQRILREIQQGKTNIEANSFELDLLETEKIYHLDQIKKISIIYRLRFLDSRYFKDEIPYEALMKVKQLQKNHQTTLKGFKILAPEEAFNLKNADDPLLFVPIGNKYYYLIHQWGNDLSFWRKIKMWPYQSLQNMAIFMFLLSIIFVALIPERFTNGELTPPKFLFFAFIMFQWFLGFKIFFMIKKGKNFSSTAWKSPYINA